MALPGTTSINNIALIGGGQVATTGAIFFVSSTAAGASDDAQHGLDTLTPFRTLAFAIGQCSPNRGDTLYVMEGHVEVIQAAAGVALNAAGIRIVGLGQGRNRPLLQFASFTSASLVFQQPNCTLENCVLQLTVVNLLAAGISVEAADCSLIRCEVIVSDALGAAVLGLVTTTAAHRLRLEDCTFRGTAQSGTTAFLKLAGAPDGVTIRRCRVIGQSTSGLLWNPTANLATNLLVDDCELHALAGGTAINLVSAVTGLLKDVTLWGTAPSSLLVPASCALDTVIGYDESHPNTLPIVLPSSGTQLAAGRSLVDELAGASLNAGRVNSFVLSVDFASATWNTVGTHQILTVAGAVRLRLIPLVTTVVAGNAGATISLGLVSDTALLIAATDQAALAVNTMWVNVVPDTRLAYTQVIDQVLSGKNVGFEIQNDVFLSGVIHFLAWYEPLTAGATVTAGAGSALT